MPVNKRDEFTDLLERAEIDILTGVLKPRQRLVESDLINKYGATRNAIRNVLKELQSKKLVVHYPNRGVVVADITEKEAVELYRVRVLLESYAAPQLIEKITEEDLHILRSIQSNFIQSVKEHDFKRMAATNSMFHESTFGISSNQVLIEFISHLRTRTHLVLYHSWRHSGQLQKSSREHEELLTALEKKDLPLFIRINTGHVLASIRSYLGKPWEEPGEAEVLFRQVKSLSESIGEIAPLDPPPLD